MKATEGPWEADKYGSFIWADDENGRFPVAQTRGWGHLTGAGGLGLREEAAIEIQKANARLIAAAPKMLKMLPEAYEQDGYAVVPALSGVPELIAEIEGPK